MIKVLSPAKINCFLYVTAKRDDGYHDLTSLMACIELYDEIEIREIPCDMTSDERVIGDRASCGRIGNKIRVLCDHPNVPDGEHNIAYKAASLFYKNLSLSENKIRKQKDYELSIKIKKKIPVGAGLGGGSSNAASVLMALNKLHGNIFSKSQLIETGCSIGADVPFFIFGSPAIARGIGGKLEKCVAVKPYYILLCYPGVSASTHKVFNNFEIKLTEKSKLDINTRLNVWLDIQGKSKTVDVAKFIHNDLEKAAFRLYPDIADTKEEMEFVLSEKVYMTGSGSSLFAFFIDYKKAEKAYSLLLDRWEGSAKEVVLTSFKI